MAESTKESSKVQSEAPVSNSAESMVGEPEKPKKKGLPAWVVLAVLALVGGVIYYVYMDQTKEPPPHVITKKKG